MTSEKAYAVEARLDNLTSAQTGWANFGSFSNGWGPAVVAKYRLGMAGIVYVEMQNVSPGTTTNGTVVLTPANGLPAGFRPGVTVYKPVRTDNLATQAPSFRVDADGTIYCYGIAPSGVTRVDANFEFFAEN